MARPAVSVIIPSYQNGHVIARVVRAFLEQAPEVDAEIVVVDDASTDDTQAVLATYANDPRLHVVRNERTLGAGGSRNRGLDRCSAREIVVFSDGDCVPAKGFLAAHAAFHRRDPRPQAVGWGTISHPPEIPVTPLMRLGNVVESRPHFPPEGSRDYKVFATTNTSLRREFLDLRFDESTFSESGFEDTEFGYRLYRKGLILYDVPDAVSYHYHFLTPEQYMAKVRRYGRLLRQWTRKCDPALARELNEYFNFNFDWHRPFDSRNWLNLRKRLTVNPLTFPLFRALARRAESRDEVAAVDYYLKLYPRLFLQGWSEG
jgi:glycosyltransferase involved in cell wall biosynthesis